MRGLLPATIELVMDISFIFWVVAAGLAGFLLYMVSALDVLWARRKVLAEGVAAMLLVGLPFLLVTHIAIVPRVLFVVAHVLLLLLAARLVFGRLPELFLRRSTVRNALAAGLLVVLGGLVLFWRWLGLIADVEAIQLGLLTTSLMVGVLLVYQVVWTLRHYKLRKLAKHLTLKELPTVTLAIPARNETHALSECLAAAVASDYPKLEIIVLDDCSQDRTSAIIKSFAQEGVRFIQGDQPSKGWLGKNQAFKALAEHASGDYILFAGVDTRLSPQSIRKLVSYALANDAAMVSVLPQRRDGVNFATLLWQLRYYWQIVLPMTRHRVPVASQAWLIKQDALQHLGGFKAVKGKVMPEGSFARRLFGVDMYRFIISNTELGITTAKRWSSQIESAIRFLYPTFKRQPFHILMGSLALISVMLLPFVMVIARGIRGELDLVWAFAILACVVLLVGYALVVVRTVPRNWLLTLLIFPISLVQEFILLLTSMIMYEFGEVNWKGRNVCYPVIASNSATAKQPVREILRRD